MTSKSIVFEISLAIIKTISTIYDIISFPIYFLIQKPLKTLSESARQKAIRVNHNTWTCLEPNHVKERHFIEECETVAELFSRAVTVFSDKNCFGFRRLLAEEDERQADGKVFRKLHLQDYEWFTYNQIDTRVEHVARGLRALGVREGDPVVIFAETRIEWMLTAQALFRLGAAVVTIYATLGEEAVIHGINETEAAVVVTTHDLLPKLNFDRLSRVKHVVFIEGLKRTNFTSTQVSFQSFSKLEANGSGAQPLPSVTISGQSKAVLMYTSGSTGVPKAVIISHENLLSAIRAFFAIAHALTEGDVYCAYLPLAHVLELSAELFFFCLGLSVGFATPLTLTNRSTALKRGVLGDTSLLKPTVMCAVPTVLDRIRKSIEEEVVKKGAISRAIFHFSVEYKKRWTQKGFRTPIIDSLVFRQIRNLLGGRLRLMATGSAPLAPETHEFVRTVLCVDLLQGYGLTETTASATLSDLCDLSVGRVGPPIRGVRIRLVDWTEGNYRLSDKPHPRGEIVVGGPMVTKGYFKNPELTRESYFTEDGIQWFYTGDIGQMDGDGALRIVDRKKDLVKLQFGEYISLGKIESTLKSCPLVDNICVYGDSFHSYLIAIIAPNFNILQKETNLDFRSLCEQPEVIQKVSEQIRDFGRRSGLHKTEIPTKVHLVAEEWVPDSGLVTAALKLRRKNIQDFYEKAIHKLYGKESSKST